MAKVVVYQNSNGIEILRGTIPKKPMESIESYFSRVAERTRPGQKYSIVDIPHDWFKNGYLTTFRSAWFVDSEDKLCIDMIKAKQIWVDLMRHKRDEVLTSLDIDFMKAVEDANVDEIKKIGSIKKELRNLPDVLGSMTFGSISELQSYSPPILAITNK